MVHSTVEHAPHAWRKVLHGALLPPVFVLRAPEPHWVGAGSPTEGMGQHSTPDEAQGTPAHDTHKVPC